MLIRKQKKSQLAAKGNRFLISVVVMGSAGPIRFVVNEDEVVASVIGTALKTYARQGRLPVLGTCLDNFILYATLSGAEALAPWATIGSAGVRNFILCKKAAETEEDVKEASSPRHRRFAGTRILWAWFGKFRTPKIFSHSSMGS